MKLPDVPTMHPAFTADDSTKAIRGSLDDQRRQRADRREKFDAVEKALTDETFLALALLGQKSDNGRYDAGRTYDEGLDVLRLINSDSVQEAPPASDKVAYIGAMSTSALKRVNEFLREAPGTTRALDDLDAFTEHPLRRLAETVVHLVLS